jgi:hypothetical protein
MTRRWKPALALLVLAALAALGLTALPAWFWHPLGYCTGTPHQVMLCKGYNAWSGIQGSFLTNLPGWLAALALLWFHHNCHEPGCLAIVKKGKTHCGKHGVKA